MDSLCLTQVVNGPTRGENLLDLVLTNNSDLVHNCSISDPEISDHKVVTLGLLLPQCTTDESAIREDRFVAMNFFLDKVDWSGLLAETSLIGQAITQSNTAEALYKLLLDELYECCKRHVPERKSKKQNFILRERRILMRKRRKLRSRVVTLRGVEADRTINTLTAINIALKNSVDEEQLREERKAVEAIKKNSKYFYAFAKKKNKTSPPVGPIIKDGEIICNTVQIANELRAHYRNTYSTPYYQNVNSVVAGWAGPDRESRLTEVTIDKAGIFESLKKLKEDSAPGPNESAGYTAETLCHNLSETPRRTVKEVPRSWNGP